MLLSSVLILQLCRACTSTPILMSILPGWPCYGVCALWIHPGVWSLQRGIASSSTDWPGVMQHTNTLSAVCPAAAIFCLWSLLSLDGCQQEPQSALSRSKLRQGSPAGQGPQQCRCDLDVCERYSADDRFGKLRGRGWLNRENSCVYFLHQKFLLLLLYLMKHIFGSTF